MSEPGEELNGSRPILELKSVSRAIKTSDGEISTIRNIDFSFNRGEIYNLVGPSGAGKTSLLRLLNRLDDPSSGEILYNGKPLISYKPTELRVKIAMLFQEPYLFEGTVLDNLRYCCPDRNVPNVEFHLERVGLHDKFANKNIRNLSVGERQRVALARSLFREPEVILLDEPTSALDPASARKIEKLILVLSHDLGLTAIIVTHNPEQALRMGGNTLLLVKGELIEAGQTEQVLNEPSTEMGRKYINNELS